MHSDDRTRALRGTATAGCRTTSRYGQGGVDNLAGEGFEVLLADQVKANAVQAFDVREGGLRVAQSLFFKIGDTLMTGTTSPYL